MPLHDIGSAEDFPAGKGKRVEVAGKTLAVYHAEDGYHAVDDMCPHRGASFADGPLEGFHGVCLLHGALVDVRTGACTLPCEENVRAYAVRVDGDHLFVELG